MASIPQTPLHPGQTAAGAAAPAVKPARHEHRHYDHEAYHRPSYACPRCFSTQVMAEPIENPWEWIINRLGIRNMYCRQCSHTFIWL